MHRTLTQLCGTVTANGSQFQTHRSLNFSLNWKLWKPSPRAYARKTIAQFQWNSIFIFSWEKLTVCWGNDDLSYRIVQSAVIVHGTLLPLSQNPNYHTVFINHLMQSLGIIAIKWAVKMFEQWKDALLTEEHRHYLLYALFLICIFYKLQI